MRKAVIVFLVAALSLSIVAVAGCGTDQNKEDAKAFMMAGDEYYDTFVTEWEGLQEKQTAMVTQVMGGDYSSITGEAGQQMATDIEDLFVSMQGNLKSANDEYEKINGLENVTDYEDYAGLMQESIVLWNKALNAGMAFKDEVMQVLTDMAAGQQVDLMSVLTGSTALQEITSLTEDAQAKAKEADSLKTDKKLAE
jgi:hypothetical protein